ncbi:MAG: DUF3842 family protein [Candidatus Schekmanbacteria bacterium]|nr:DUF3842 family protein [Candidatus Schekmanbacteria bacterium]
MPVIGVIDGQGGGIGSHIIRNLRDNLPPELDIVALGTNAVATSAMMKSKANRGASGENAIIQTVPTLNLILGTLAIVIPNSMMGEITPKIAKAISSNQIPKILLPMKIANVEIVGAGSEPLPHLINDMLAKVRVYLDI